MPDLTKVAVLLGSFAAGGSERAMINFANGLTARGIAVDLIAGRGPDDFRSIVDSSVNVINLYHGMFKSIPYLRRYLHREQPDILFASQLHVNIVAMLTGVCNFRLKTKIVLREATTPSQHAKILNGWKEHLSMKLAKLLFHRADYLISAGEASRVDAVEFYGLNPDKTSTVYSSFTNQAFYELATDPVEHRWLEDGSRVIASMGRVMPVKDFPTLIASLAIVRQQEDVKLMIIGETNRDPAHFDLVKKTVSDLDLEDAVDFIGFHQNPFPYLVKSEMYVLSSKFEGLPGALVQAMALGCKIVATDCKSGPREILDGGSRGKLVTVGNAQAMADAILQSLNSEHDRSLGKEWASEFSESTSISRLIRVFENTINHS